MIFLCTRVSNTRCSTTDCSGAKVVVSWSDQCSPSVFVFKLSYYNTVFEENNVCVCGGVSAGVEVDRYHMFVSFQLNALSILEFPSQFRFLVSAKCPTISDVFFSWDHSKYATTLVHFSTEFLFKQLFPRRRPPVRSLRMTKYLCLQTVDVSLFECFGTATFENLFISPAGAPAVGLPFQLPKRVS